MALRLCGALATWSHLSSSLPLLGRGSSIPQQQGSSSPSAVKTPPCPGSLPCVKAEQHVAGAWALGPHYLIYIPDQPLSVGLILKPQWPQLYNGTEREVSGERALDLELGSGCCPGFVSRIGLTILASVSWSRCGGDNPASLGTGWGRSDRADGGAPGGWRASGHLIWPATRPVRAPRCRHRGLGWVGERGEATRRQSPSSDPGWLRTPPSFHWPPGVSLDTQCTV